MPTLPKTTTARVPEVVREKILEAIDSMNDATNALDEENIYVKEDAPLMHLFWTAQEDLRRATANLGLFLDKV